MHLPPRRIFAIAATLACLASTALSGQQPAPKRDSAQLVRTRMRVVGVFDRQTGEPLAGVEVRDYNSGLTSLTTRTGTVALLLDDTLGTLINIKKIGYTPQTLMVGTAVTDTIPLTIDMLRAGQLLETTIITADGRSLRLGRTDTVQALIANGFYERRLRSAAPSGAFITGDKIRATQLLSDARYFGRGICEDNLFVDGVRWIVPKREGRFSMEGIDAMLHPTDVAGLETYRFGDLPPSAIHTYGGPGALSGAGSVSAVANGLNSMTVQGCVTLIWLKH